MATVINNPNPGTQTSSTDTGPGTGFVVGLILVVLLIVLFFAFGRGAFRGDSTPSGGTNINVPEKVDVDVNRGQ
jgi:hypothetical protein